MCMRVYAYVRVSICSGSRQCGIVCRCEICSVFSLTCVGVDACICALIYSWLLVCICFDLCI